MKLLYFIFCLFFSITFNSAQKSVYIPIYLQNPNDVNGAQYSVDKTAESENFILIWGNTVGTDPTNYPDTDIRFNPQQILSIMEDIYIDFKALDFLDDSPGTNLSLYKIPIIIYATWGDNGQQGFANGGDADGVIGAFWAHPNALRTGEVAAHEFAHSMQAQTIIDYRKKNGLGPVWLNSGIFWESHGNFMRNLLYPKDVTAWGMDVYHTETLGDWKNTYENYEYLFAIMEDEGISIIGDLWRKSLSNEYPLQAYKRIAGYDQTTFNDKMYKYARRMATHDFPTNNIGGFLRQYRKDDLRNYLPSTQAAYTILKQIEGSETRFEVPVHIAPEEYAYSLIPLHITDDSCSVIVKFKGQTAINDHAGWRYGFVTAHPDGTISRYSDIYSDIVKEIFFDLEGDEDQLFLVVMGAPKDNIQTNKYNDTWKGYPKHFRYPYELNIIGAVPEGFQEAAKFRAQLKQNGALHANGGGWVANGSNVASTVYVGPHAMVLGNSNISGNVRLENTALVRNVQMSGDVLVKDNAFIDKGIYTENAIIKDQAFSEENVISGNAVLDMRAKVSFYKLSGEIEVGGDVVVYNDEGDCDNGVYYRMTNYYENNLLECDNRTADHPQNKDVNGSYSQFTEEEMAMKCNCENLPDCLPVSKANEALVSASTLISFPNPFNSTINFKSLTNIDKIESIIIYNTLGQEVYKENFNATSSITIDLTQISVGLYYSKISYTNKKIDLMKITKI